MRYLAGVILGAVLLATPALVQAQEATEPTPAQIRAAAEAFDRGREAYKEEQYQAAAEQFERADANAPSETALELALRARDKANNPDRAATLAALAVTRHPQSKGLQKLAAEILQQYRRDLFELRVTCAEPCDLTSDAKIVHGAPALERTVYLMPGSHSLTADFGGSRTKAQTLAADAGGKGDLWFEVPEQTAQPEAHPPVASAPTAPVEPPPEQPAEKPVRHGWSPAIFWTGAAVTAAAGAFTIWSGVDTINNPGADYVRDICAEEGEDGPNCQSAYNEGRDKQLRTNIAIGATAVLGAATIVIGALATDWGGSSNEAARVSKAPKRSALGSVRVSPWLGVDGGGLGASGRF
ncbi:MAG TPA: hypothetical protein VM686_05080 [Polyangiaceae bacterium]|nr:hypothetical protein [Polyangiaceae bacterium]